MFRKFFSINLFLSLIFLVSTVFPPSAFSYKRNADLKAGREKVDESLSYKPVVFKKVCCPRCSMEFYYIHEKEGPHSHWVHYEVSKQKVEETVSDFERKTKEIESEKEEEKKKVLSMLRKREDIGEIEERLSERRQEEQNLYLQQLEIFQRPQYELRQKLTCPYDGYSFFPEGGVIEDAKLMQKSFIQKEPSIIETSFSKSIPFGVSRELSQFGYDLFEMLDEEERQKRANATEGTGETLDAFGILRAAFSQKSQSSPALTFQPLSQTAVLPVSSDYVIGPGDTLVINMWGSVQESFPIEVDREGKIMLPKAGPLYVWGLELKEVETRIKQRLDRYYTNFYMDLSMGKLRDIQVYVIGEVKRPGSYRVNSQVSIFQALYTAGGPTKLGSLRKIKLMHADGKDEEIDLYSLLLQGKTIMPFRVQSGDTIFVPAIGDVVAIAGNIKRPAIYETKSEIALSDLLSFAGGITPTGDLQRLQVERIHNNERRIMLDIELKRLDLGKFSLEDINMQNGDLVIVSPIVRLKHDFVSIIGNVERPGDYALVDGMKVSDLLKRAKGFLPATYLQRAEIARVTKDRTRQIIPVNLDSMILGVEGEDMFLNEWDVLLIYSESQAQPPSFAEIDGAVNRPGRYELSANMQISDLIFKAGSIQPGKVIKGAELFHIMPGEQPVVREIGIKQLSDVDILIDKDIILRAGDALFVKSEPGLTERKVVNIKGEVKYPGVYSIREGERLSSLIERSGGFTKEAFLSGAIFTRKSIRDIQEKMRQRFIERENKTILEEQQSMLLRRGQGVSPAQVSESLNIRREMLEYISSAELEGRMVIKLEVVDRLKGTNYDILLEDGDTLAIPQPPSATAVMGSVNNPTSVRFEKGKGVGYYIQKTGGLTKHADKAGIYVIRANGEAVSKFAMSRKIEQGDAIVIPQAFKYWTPPGQLLRDTVEILSRIAIGVGIIAALD